MYAAYHYVLIPDQRVISLKNEGTDVKLKRQSKIIELIKNEEIGTQEELSDRLREEGYEVTQATISRDIRELNLTKVTENGRQRYATLASMSEVDNEKYIKILRAGFRSIDTAGNILVINTVSGMAMAVAAAVDSLNFPEVVGCIAGDDTIFCAIKEAGETASVMRKFEMLVKEA